MTGLPYDLYKIFENIQKSGGVYHPASCFYWNSGPVHVVSGPDSMKMDIIPKGMFGLRNEIEKASPRLDVALSGAFYEFDPNSLLNNPLSILSPGKLLGEIVQNGTTIESGELGDYAYITYMNSGVYHFGVSKKVPTSSVKRGLGGLIPIITGGRPETSNSWFRTGNKKTGRCMIGHSDGSKMLLIIAQEWTNPMYNLTDFQNFYSFFGCDNVVGLDGSDSAMLWHNNSWKFINADYKNIANKTAIGFRL